MADPVTIDALQFMKPSRSVFEEMRAGGVDAVRRAIAEHGPFDAIFCMSDVMAFGVLHELHRMGLSVPGDISVVSIHNLPASEFTYPPLTTVNLPARQMGRCAAECLARWVEDDVRPTPICLDTHLVERSSTRAAPKKGA